jgi:hypothetical protein
MLGRIQVKYEIDEVVAGLMYTLQHLSADKFFVAIDTLKDAEQFIKSLVDINTKYVDLHDAGMKVIEMSESFKYNRC